METTNYTFRVELPVDFESAVKLTTEHLQEQGFGILTEIDVTRTLKEKLDVDYRQYKILGACNPQLAHRVLEVEEEIGTLLPCNVAVFEESNDTVKVAAMNPNSAMSVVHNDAVDPIADEVAQKLKTALSNLRDAVGEVKR
ncbi:DUF302 domain-containing protein [candidate division GN15 bacterium]|nr:DUF302 domain-containing protein [candidate division GN15 bacterium]